MKRLKKRYFAGLLVLAGIMLTVPAFASPPFPHKCGFGFGCGVPGAAIHQAANNFEPTYYLFGQSGYGGFGKLYIPANGDKQGLSDPAAPTLARQAAGLLAAGTYSYRISAVNAAGKETLAGAARAITFTALQAATQRSVMISWAETSGAASYNVYGRTANSWQRIATVSAVTGQMSYSYLDDGSVTPNGALPTSNATLPRLMSHAVTFEPSYVEANCLHPSTGYKFRARVNLTGLAINNPAGLINATAPATKMNPSDFPGTLGDPRFSIRWFPSVARAPTASPPPQGPPAEGATYSTPPPGEIGSGNISGTNNPPNAQDQTNFCTFRENLFVEGRATFEVRNVIIPDPNLPETGKFNLIVKDATGVTVRTRPDAGNGGSTNDDCNNPPTPDGPLCSPPLRPAGPADNPNLENTNGDNWPRIEPSSYLGNYQVSVTAGTATILSNYDTQISCNDNANGTSHVVAGAGPEGVGLPPGANVHVICTVTNTRKPVVVTP
jgi:hypothetical protein